MSTPALAAGAYARLAKMADPAAIGGGSVPGLGGPAAGSGSFGQILQGVIGDVASAGSAADKQTAQAVQGQSDIVNVVTAVAESELALETMVSVRDRMITAYEEIMRMPI
jgi:flagellar hook-basal body complex protein FliE